MKKESRSLRIAVSALALSLALPTASTTAAVLYDTVGANYSQNFDTLGNTGTPAWTNDSTLTGWYWILDNGTTPATYTATTGSTSSQNQVLSLGATDSSDRALGSQNGNTASVLRYGVQIANSTGGALTSFSLSYTGEQWRVVGNDLQDFLTFEYQVFDSGVTNPLAIATGWTEVSDLNFTDTITSSTSSGGSLLASENLSDTVSGITWSNGQELWLRWSDPNISNRRAMMGIDDVSFSAVPEPTAPLLVGIGACLLGMRRRR